MIFFWSTPNAKDRHKDKRQSRPCQWSLVPADECGGLCAKAGQGTQWKSNSSSGMEQKKKKRRRKSEREKEEEEEEEEKKI